MAAASQLGTTMGTAPACRALGVPRSSLYRRRRPKPTAEPRPRPERALTEAEQDAVLEVLHSERFVDQTPAEVYATLLDEGVYLCSVRTMYRLPVSAPHVDAVSCQDTYAACDTTGRMKIPPTPLP